MKNLVIAKRYAKALFNLAREAKGIEQYGQELDAFVQLLKDVPGFADYMQNPLYPEPSRKAAFQVVAEKAGMTPIMRSFVGLLIGVPAAAIGKLLVGRGLQRYKASDFYRGREATPS